MSLTVENIPENRMKVLYILDLSKEIIQIGFPMIIGLLFGFIGDGSYDKCRTTNNAKLQMQFCPRPGK